MKVEICQKRSLVCSLVLAGRSWSLKEKRSRESSGRGRIWGTKVSPVTKEIVSLTVQLLFCCLPHVRFSVLDAGAPGDQTLLTTPMDPPRLPAGVETGSVAGMQNYRQSPHREPELPPRKSTPFVQSGSPADTRTKS